MFSFRTVQIRTYLQRSNLGSVSFPKIARSPFYVDKTLFIEKILYCGADHVLITAPRRFNKSVNLNMLKCFLETKQYEPIFARLKIGKKPAMDLLGAYPVIWLDLKDGAKVINSYEDAVRAVKISLKHAYWKHPYLMTSKKLSSAEKSICESWFNDGSVESFGILDVEDGLFHLCYLVSKHFGRKCFLLVDEYDAICTSAFSRVNVDVLTDIIDFYAGIIGSVVKQNQDFVERSVLTSITRVMSAGTSNPINNVIAYPFLENSTFIDCYGILVEE